MTTRYIQHEIANTLSISPPTFSKYPLSLKRNAEERNYRKRLFEVYHYSLQGYDELIKNSTIIDSTKTEDKEKTKVINLIM
jgi:hypothetical protein